MNYYNNLRKYQLKAINTIIKTKRVGLWLDMGGGKTVTSLTVAQKLIDECSYKFKVLIIAPLRVCNTVWHEEIQRWSHLKHLTWSIVVGNEKQRIEALNKDVNIYIVSRDNVSWLYKKNFVNWDLIIIDESASFKNIGAKRFKDLAKFSYQRMIQLTGTPSPNGLIDIWSQLFLLDHGQRLGKNIYSYKYRYFHTCEYTRKITCIRPEEIYKAIQDIIIVMKPDDYIELPELIHTNTKVELDRANYKIYRELERKYITEIHDKTITVSCAAALSNKLFQYCNGAIYDENKNVIEVHNLKIEALKDIIENNPNDNIIVAYNFKSDLQRLQANFKHAILMDKEGKAVELWNQNKIKLLLCHPASAGEGLNLQTGGNILVWFSLTWNLKNYQQMNKRLHRHGQLKPVIINHIIVKDCIDEKIMEVLTKKEVTQSALLDALAFKNN